MRVRTPAIRCDRPTIQGLPAFSPAQCPRVGGKLILPQRTFRVMLKTTRVCVSTWGRTPFQNAAFKLSIGDIARPEIRKWHAGYSERLYLGNRALAVLRKILSRAARDWELRNDNPALGIKL